MTDFETILLERKGGSEGKGAVGWITLNRPKALNALNKQVLDDVVAALEELEADDSIGAVVITGSEKAFAAGA
ncbi:enoyl-CoA hydratase-related protein, partial [Nocardia neocaledoniensis]|uniref:enoyl-CoA hydratase-related protein n=1 Tax=Nocardia neocaledoniensis TaxID=236511 RepID=UPI0024554FC0